jgi:hypothetical protein
MIATTIQTRAEQFKPISSSANFAIEGRKPSGGLTGFTIEAS